MTNYTIMSSYQQNLAKKTANLAALAKQSKFNLPSSSLQSKTSVFDGYTADNVSNASKLTKVAEISAYADAALALSSFGTIFGSMYKSSKKASEPTQVTPGQQQIQETNQSTKDLDNAIQNYEDNGNKEALENQIKTDEASQTAQLTTIAEMGVKEQSDVNKATNTLSTLNQKTETLKNDLTNAKSDEKKAVDGAEKATKNLETADKAVKDLEAMPVNQRPADYSTKLATAKKALSDANEAKVKAIKAADDAKTKRAAAEKAIVDNNSEITQANANLKTCETALETAKENKGKLTSSNTKWANKIKEGKAKLDDPYKTTSIAQKTSNLFKRA